ncbi:MAG TPA: two-component system response regulator [Lachnospiraceae bacterium]|nr:two-component system response regulator [Lachnospiraceae bacterium]
MTNETPKFLICDDSILARKKLVDTLNSLGYEDVISVANGDEAVNSYKTEKPDVVILDIVMPVKDGITATREIIEYDKDALIIISSSVGTQSHLKEVIKAGAKDFIQKPIDPKLLDEIIKHCLKK